MTSIAVLGANGQVAAELCLILHRQSNITLIPVCRNRAGSGFLRAAGIRCRHGLVSDPNQARALFGDCDVVINSTLPVGTPKEVRLTEERIIRNTVDFAKPSARIIYFSSAMVYGDPRPGIRIRWRSAYGTAKFRAERLLQRHAGNREHEHYILRLGHVCGNLQNITRRIRDDIKVRAAKLPGKDQISNTVYTATIAEAILNIAAGKEKPGVYDLMSKPQWTWREVYEWEAHSCGLELFSQRMSVPEASIWFSRATLRDAARRTIAIQGLKQAALRMMVWLPIKSNERIRASFYTARARAEIAELTQNQDIPQELLWMPLGSKFLQSLTPTSQLLMERRFDVPPLKQEAMAIDLPFAVY